MATVISGSGATGFSPAIPDPPLPGLVAEGPLATPLAAALRAKDDGYGIAAGALIGFLFGMYRLIQKAMREDPDQSK